MVFGMTLLLWAIGHGDTGVATILSATTPVIMLPLLWITIRQADRKSTRLNSSH